MSSPFPNQLITSAQMAHTNSRLRLRWINDSILARAAKLAPNFFPFSSEWHYLSKQTSSDLFGGLILRPRLTLRNGIARACALPVGAKNPNASYRLNWQIARDLRSDKKRPIGHTA